MDTKDIFEQVGNLERHPKLKLEKLGQKMTVKMLDEGNFVSAETIQDALKDKGIKGIKARDSLVFNVDTDDGIKEFWVSRTNFTNIKQLAKIRESNNSSLVGVSVIIEKVSEKDPSRSTLEIRSA